MYAGSPQSALHKVRALGALWALALCALACDGPTFYAESTRAGVDGRRLYEGKPKRKERVDDKAPLVTAQSSCVALGAEELVLGNSPEGDLWIRSGKAVRIVDIEGNERRLDTAAGEVESLLPISDSEAMAVAAGSLWRVDATGMDRIPLPTEIGKPLAAFGDVATAETVFIVTDLGLYQRQGDQWAGWNADGGEVLKEVQSLGDVDAACSALDSALWFRRGDKAWRLDFGPLAMAAPVKNTPKVVGLDVDMDLGPTLLLESGRLRFGTETWTEVSFPSKARLSANGGGYLWAVDEQGVYRRALDGSWSKVSSPLADNAAGVEGLWANATGGSWIKAGAQVCHQSLGASLRVRGLRPAQQRIFALANLRALGRGTALKVALDGITLNQLGADTDGAWVLNGLSLSGDGQHVMELSMSGADGQETRRRLPYEILPGYDVSWARDIKRIQDQRCAGNCHVPGGSQVDLSTLTQWRALNAQIREEVVFGDMPPAPSTPLSARDVDTITRWIQGGMRP